MRHRIAGKKLNRNTSLRKATLRDLAKATLIRQRIRTTKTKAKEARKLVEELITLGKSGTLAAKRHAFAILCDHKIVSNLFNKTAPRFKNRVGGYTRIISLGFRRGDNAELAFLELTEKEEVVKATPKPEQAAKKKGPKPTVEKAQIIEPAAVDVPAMDESVEPAKEQVKEPVSKKDSIKTQAGKPIPQDKGKKNIMGNIRKMFNRKSSGK